MNRRDLIKSLALSPLFVNRSFGSALLNSNFLQGATASNVFILLHGLFFLEYVNNTLVITAPEVSDHDYRMGEPDDIVGNQHQISGPNNSLDLSGPTSGLIGDTTCTNRFPQELLQFSKGDTGVGDLNGTFHFRRILPCPLDIIPLRKGNRSDFPAIGKIRKNIDSHANGAKQMLLVTCLRYQGTLSQIGCQTNRCHLYAEPDCKQNADIDHVNGALRAAKDLFANGRRNFDLQLSSKKDPPAVKAQPPGGDDKRATELPAQAIEEDPLFEIPGLCPPLAPNAQPPVAPGIGHFIGVNVANCGQFGVIP